MNGFCWDLHLSENSQSLWKWKWEVRGKEDSMHVRRDRGAEINEEVRGKVLPGARTVVRVRGPLGESFLQREKK